MNIVCSEYPRAHSIFTESAKKDDGVASAAVLALKTVSTRFPSSCFVFSAEAEAIMRALQSIPELESSRFLIFSDSLSCLQAIGSDSTVHPDILSVSCSIDIVMILSLPAAGCQGMWISQETLLQMKLLRQLCIQLLLSLTSHFWTCVHSFAPISNGSSLSKIDILPVYLSSNPVCLPYILSVYRSSYHVCLP